MPEYGVWIVNRKKIFYLAVGALALIAGCSRTDNSEVLATAVADEMVAWLKDQQTADVKEVLDQIAEVEASREQLVQDSIGAEEESRSEEESIKESSREEASAQKSLRESARESESESRYRESSIAYSIAMSEAESRYDEAVLAEESEEASIASSIAESIAASSAAESSIAESRSIAASLEESSLEELRQQIQEAGGDYLLALCEGTNLTPYGVATIDDTDAPLVHKLFENTVVIGDSRVEGAEWVLSESEVFFSRGGYAGNLHELARRAAGMYPDKALFWIGLNDMSVYEAKTDRFVSDYEDMIKDFLSVVPDCEIYIHNQPDVPKEGLENFEFAKYIDDYNDAMKEMCERNGWTYVDGSTYLRPEYFAEDGLHFQKKFYRYWVQDMANQLDLWGDLAE